MPGGDLDLQAPLTWACVCAHEVVPFGLTSPTTDTMIRAEEVDPRRSGVAGSTGI